MTDPSNTEMLKARGLSRCLRDRSVALIHETADLGVDLEENLPHDWPGWEELSPLASLRIADAKAAARDSGEPQNTGFTVGHNGASRHFQLQVTPDDNGLFLVLHEVTAEHQRDIAMASLMRELSHRSKNLLAIVQSIAMQTAIHSGDMDDFLNRFRGRLQALARTQDLVTESDWRGTLFRSLVAAQLARLGQSSIAAVTVSGDNPLLGPNASLHIGLAIHELATNAVLHGGLAAAKSEVQIAATVGNGLGKARTLTIDWRETRPTGELGSVPRFGTVVLERIVPMSVGGSAAYSVGSELVRYKLTVPAEQFES